ncbi:MAG: cyclic nucleotide-binding domain-containing protein [Xanthobacteraceae bacterium]|nr:cyclic nucleotide-binding domain-containing protein [Xanthobacteraceae bacterium]
MIRPSIDALSGFVDSARNVVLAVGLICIVVLPMHLPYSEVHWLEAILWACLAFYALEWALDISRWSKRDHFRERLLSFQHVIDILAVVPILAANLLGIPATTAWLLGAFWLLKLPAATSGFSLLGHVFLAEANSLTTVVKVFVFVLVMAAIAMYLVERDAQPAAFGTLVNSLYWAVTTLTTTGYGDIVPVTPLGRLIAGFVMISGLAVFGLWTGILATGFAAETRRRDFVRTWEFVAKVPFFKPLSPAAIIEIARMLRPIDVAERTVIVRKGRQGDCMYFIAEGLVEVAGAGVQLGSGAFFGEMALLGDGTRTATVTAVVPSTLLVLDLTDYRIFAAHYPDLAHAVEEEAARRRAERNKKPDISAEPGAAANRHATVDE